MSSDRKKLSYIPVEGAPAWAKIVPSCDYCRHRRDSSCKDPCRAIRDPTYQERSSRARKEHTNELNLEGRKKISALSPTLIYSKLLEDGWIFRSRQLQALKLLNEGRTRSEVCQELCISRPALSALIKRAKNEYLRFDAKRRALVALELKKLRPSKNEHEV